MEYEFIDLDKCSENAKWLCHFLEDILKLQKPVPSIYIHCDSQSLIKRAQSNIYIYIIVSLDIYVVDIILLDNYS